jgi:dTDP-4-dehydrorhamnose reductase
LIVGGDSFIGRALGQRHVDGGDGVTYTTRRPGSAGAELLDLRNVPPEWAPPNRFDMAYLCAAVARVDECEKDPARARAVNVDGTLSVARALLRGGSFVVFLSTNYVFCDENPRPAPESEYCPITEYGRQKVAAEQGFAALPGEKAIVRLTKVFGRDTALIERWRRALENRESVVAFNDVHIAPVSLSFAVTALHRIGAEKRTGVHHLSGRDDVSYLVFAKAIAAKLGAATELVEGRSFRDLNASFPSPRHGSLDMTATSQGLGIRPQAAEDVVADVLASG